MKKLFLLIISILTFCSSVSVTNVVKSENLSAESDYALISGYEYYPDKSQKIIIDEFQFNKRDGCLRFIYKDAENHWQYMNIHKSFLDPKNIRIVIDENVPKSVELIYTDDYLENFMTREFWNYEKNTHKDIRCGHLNFSCGVKSMTITTNDIVDFVFN